MIGLAFSSLRRKGGGDVRPSLHLKRDGNGRLKLLGEGRGKFSLNIK